MERLQERLNKELENVNSIAEWAIGYYIDNGGQHDFNYKIPIFDFEEKTKTNTRVLIDFLGSMMWINMYPENVFYGNYSRKGEKTPSLIGKSLRAKLEAITKYQTQ
jgi:hypothetical protein